MIGRCEYAKTSELLLQAFGASANGLQAALERAIASPGLRDAALAGNPSALNSAIACVDLALLKTLRLEENRLAWLVYMIGE